MKQASQISLFIAITCWAALVGAILYSHIAYFPGYLSHLPDSNKIITEYGVQDEKILEDSSSTHHSIKHHCSYLQLEVQDKA